jgi:hypothetical protein
MDIQSVRMFFNIKKLEISRIFLKLKIIRESACSGALIRVHLL